MTERRFFNRLGWILALDIFIWVGGQLGVAVLINHLASSLWDQEWLFWLATMGPQYLLAFPITLKLCKGLPRNELYQHKLKIGDNVQIFLMILGISLVGNLIGTIVTTVLGNITGWNFSADATDLLYEHSAGWLFFIVALIGPVIEEILYRKVLIDRLIVFGDGAAIMLSALFFGLVHGNFSQVFYAFGIGIILAFVYIRTGRLRYTIGLHMAFNFLQGFLPMMLTKQINLDELLEGMMQLDLNLIVAHLGGILGLLGYELLFLVLAVIGVVFLIANRQKYKLNKGEIQMSAGEMLRLFFTTPGTCCWIVAIVFLFVINLL